MDRKLLMMIVAPLALAAGIFLAGWCMSRSMGPTVIDDPAQYHQFMAKWPMPELTPHFPEALPQGAQDVRMVLDPGGLQDAARLELQFHLPQEAIDDLLRRSGALPATNPAAPAVARMQVRPDPQAVRLIRITSAARQPIPLPPEYRLTDFFCCSQDDAWAHGRIYGTAINRSTRHIIHFAQAW